LLITKILKDRAEKEDDELVEFDEALIGSYESDDEVKDLDDHHISNLLIITRNPDDPLPSTSSDNELPPEVLSLLNDGLLAYEHNLQNKQSLSPLSSSPSSTGPSTSAPTATSSSSSSSSTSKGKKKNWT
jgi:hypothetical protein